MPGRDEKYGFLKFSHIQRSDNSMGIFVQLLSSIGSESTGLAKNALMTLKNFAKENGAETVLLQFQPANQRLFKIAKKKLEYLGEYPFFHPEKGYVVGKEFPVFKINLQKVEK